MYGNGVIMYGRIHLPVVLILLDLVQALPVSFAAAAGAIMPLSAGLMSVTASTRPTAVTIWVFVLFGVCLDYTFV